MQILTQKGAVALLVAEMGKSAKLPRPQQVCVSICTFVPAVFFFFNGAVALLVAEMGKSAKLPRPQQVCVSICTLAPAKQGQILTRTAYVSIRQHTSAYVSIRQHTSACVSIRQQLLTRTAYKYYMCVCPIDPHTCRHAPMYTLYAGAYTEVKELSQLTLIYVYACPIDPHIRVGMP